MRLRKAFTLIELLVVIAITAILITLIGIPLVQGLNLTRAAQSFAEAQDISREVSSRFNRELSTAATVLDNSMPEAAIEVKLPSRVGGFGYLHLHNALIDMVAPAQGDPTQPQYNPGRNRQDPTLNTAIGQVILPVAPGQKITRYFIGLQRPILANGNEGLYINAWMPNMPGANSGQNNLYTLYRAEVEPYVFNRLVGRYVPNTDFFPVDLSTGRVVLNDPGFFLFDPSNPYGGDLQAHRDRLVNWMRVSRAVVQDDRTDLLMPEVDEATQAVVYEGNLPRVRSLASFTPVRVNAEPAPGNNTLRSGLEAIDNETRIASEFYGTEMPGWTMDSVIRVFRRDPRIQPTPPYFVGRNLDGVYQIAAFTPDPGANERVDGVPMFNVSSYEASVQAGNPRIGPNIYPGTSTRVELMLFNVDERRGRIQMRFPAGAAYGYTPAPSSDLPNSKLTGWLNSSARQQYNPSGDLARRFVDLRDPNAFSTTLPNFNPFDPVVRGYSNPNAFITPGSEALFAPDQRPGPNYGRPIRYTRVAPGESVGINQYRINYTDIREPDYGTMGLPDPNANADVRAFIQPRYKKGYIELNSDLNLPLPQGQMQISFDFQVNLDSDAVVVDYDSNQQIRFDLTVRRFPGGTRTPPLTVSVSDVVAVRNFAR
ncbi:MAG: prepilin-type N-terminal cleavage/methylation domain-containing protein [Armatimonadota bacterium]|nr:prepilin-type N-terminal cleavage/methylation domain-containing protein [Armatimonadota bacterium]